MIKNKEETKALLKDWMTSTTVLLKTDQPKCSSADIVFWWRQKFGILMNEKYVNKCLYGSRGYNGKQVG